MHESFLDEVKNEGKIRILGFPETSAMEHLVFGPIITRDHKIGIQIQDKISGKYLMIEVGKTQDETKTFLSNLQTSFDTASKCYEKLHQVLKDKSTSL